MKKYKVIPCISEGGRKGWKIVEDNNYDLEFEYRKGGGITFTIYYIYEDALRDCEHLNGKSKVFGQITKDSWDVLRMLFKGWR